MHQELTTQFVTELSGRSSREATALVASITWPDNWQVEWVYDHMLMLYIVSVHIAGEAATVLCLGLDNPRLEVSHYAWCRLNNQPITGDILGLITFGGKHELP